ncbi:MAG: phospholipid carrier-dependent glycosyltransferase [Clostridia bacterium]|nr:phospholipid carrier-dependent glycosyltransferase [Clostridia bacterium]
MRQELLHPQDYKLHMAARDWMIIFVITSVYAAIGFWNLGATNAPQKGYTSTAQGETVVFDLGANQEDFHIYYNGGISGTQFSFAVSDDGFVYGDEYDALFNQGECFKWLALRTAVYDANGKVTDATGGMIHFSGRYVRMTFAGAGAAIWETGFVDGAGKVLPIISATASGGYEGRQNDPSALIDEQDTVPEKPTYYNSMYFDEVYHARTGYEHAHALHAYENTHPPLGKVFMSWCISLMGMTPFAWRFPGALAGVLMLPALYLLARQLFGRTRWAALSTLLMAADCMHYTQTRIATIDSFPVLFMIVMFWFMLRWSQMSFFHQSLGRTFVPLALSGAFMGMAIASKWIGCYGAVGLAVLFFARMFTLWRQSVYAKAHRGEDAAFARAADGFAKNAVLTLAACVVFFVIVPALIYAASFIPYLRAYGPVRLNMTTVQRLWDAQVTMFSYHSNLVATHPYSSVWYEWPLIIKPMWYYKDNFAGVGMASTILSFGNPAVWWTGFVGIMFVLCYSMYRNALPSLRAVHAREDAYDRAMPLIAVGFLSAYLPWMLISRLTFIYHYFASVPFIILATAQVMRYIERSKPRFAHMMMVLLCIVSILLFIGFYPLASGVEVPRTWCDMMNWFDHWMQY